MGSKKPEVSVVQYFAVNFPCDWEEFRMDWGRVERLKKLNDMPKEDLSTLRNLRLLIEAIDVAIGMKTPQDLPRHSVKAGWDALIRGDQAQGRPALHQRVLGPNDLRVLADALVAVSSNDFSDREGLMDSFVREFKELLGSVKLNRALGA
jgi:hypothetical protein